MMNRIFRLNPIRVAELTLLRTAVFVFGLISATIAQSHELTPSIADFEVKQRQLAMELRLNLEAFLAGMDLDTVIDTDTAQEVVEYQRLRVLSQDEIEGEALRFFQSWIADFGAEGLGAWSIAQIDVPAVGDTELPRQSVLHLEADVLNGAQELVFAWPEKSGALILRQNGVDAPYTGFLISGSQSPAIMIGGGEGQSAWSAFTAYISAGFDHILPKGLDHILFVLGLFFFSTKMGPLLWQVSAFTLAHTVTLALGTLGLVTLPGSVVEPLIAASITFVAVENLFARRMSPWRPVVIFGFGLLHGLGFASVLEEFGLPQDQLIPALLGFNVGVELGQLTVIAAAFLLVGLWFRNRSWYFARIAAPASVAIAAIGAWWFVERVFL